MIDPTRTTMLRTRAAVELRRRLTSFQSKLISRSNLLLFPLIDPVQGLQLIEKIVTELVETEIPLMAIDRYLVEAYERANREVLRHNRMPLFQDGTFELVRAGVQNDIQALRAKLTSDILRNVTTEFSRAVTLAAVIKATRPVFQAVKDNTVRRLTDVAIVKTHNEAILDTLVALGQRQVSVLVEVRTAADGRVCPKCAAYVSRILTITEARGLFPIHPSCRCSLVPLARTRQKLRLLNNG